MKTITYLISVLFFFQSFSQKTLNLFDAVNLANKQRVLVQTMAKDKLFIEVGEKTSTAKKELQLAVTEFERNLEQLKTFAPTKDIKHEIIEEEFAYNYYKKLIMDTTKKSMNEIVKYNGIFLSICDDVVRNLIIHSKTNNQNQKYIVKNTSRATSAAIRINLLSQRLALYYALNEFNISKVDKQTLTNLENKVENNINYLTLIEFNTLEIDDSLGELVFIWHQVKGKLSESKKVSANTLFDLCNEIATKAKKTKSLYINLNKSKAEKTNKV